MEAEPPSGTPGGTANPAKEFRLPAPKFKEEVQKSLDDFSRHLNPHFSTPTGMLLPREMQPPPMYGPRGSTLPPQFLANNRRKRPSYDHQFGQPAPKQPQYEPRFHRGGHHHQRPPTSFWRGNDGNHQHRSPRGNEGFEKDVIPALLLLNWKLWCEGCDVNCTSEEEYQRHIESHRPCEVPGCSFVGHPMVMKKHARKAHSEESSNESRNGMPSAEEIEQWKEERRKRFPTKQNIILRQLAQEERLKRGERIGENKERFPLKPGSNRPAQDGFKEGPKPKKRKRRAKQPVWQVENQSTPRIMFAGTSGLDNYRKPIASCLSLLQGYGSDSENESGECSESEEVTDSKVDEPVEEVPNLGDNSQTKEQASPVQKVDMLEKKQEIESPQATTLEKADVAEQLQENVKEKVDTLEEKQQAKPETNTIENTSKQYQKKQFNRKQQHNSKEKQETRDPQVRPAKKLPYLLDYSKLRRSNQNTMLEKLLDADIRHERNVLLQCVRYVITNNFFGVGQPKVEKDGATNIQNESPSQAQNDATLKIVENVGITPPQNDDQTLSQSADIARTENDEFSNPQKDVQPLDGNSNTANTENEGASITLNEATEQSQSDVAVTSESNANDKE